ncbi:MAG: aspartate aminotransferase family protein [Longicatena sp.]
MTQIKEDDHQYIAPTYARFDVVLTHGKGARVFDENEKEYIDMGAGIGVNALGYANDEWVKAVSVQASALAHVSNLYYTKNDTLVAKKLCSLTHFKKMFFANSGAEANEGAIKVARKYSFDKYGTRRHEIITLINSFHGRSITTLSATGQDHFHQYFDPFTPGFKYAIANDIQDIKAKMNEKTCAIMIELIQGEGGVIPLDKKYVKELAKLCKQQDILLIVDEVQTGIGRTGSLYAYERYDIQPDIVTTAKGLGNGLPIGGVLLGDKVEMTLGAGDHGTTFGGNPIACAGANVVLSHMTEELFEDVIKKGEYIRMRLLAMKHIVKVDGMGLMLGATCESVSAKSVVLACVDAGLLLLTAKDKIRFLPPLTISMEELSQAMDILENVLKEMEA